MLALALPAAILTGCKSPSFGSGISAAQENKIGEWSSAQIAGEYGTLPPGIESARVAAISDRLIQQSEPALDGRTIHVTLLLEDLPETYSLPGGWVYVTTGLVERLEGDDALAGALAHEIGHALLRHAAGQLTETVGKDAVVDMLTQGKYNDTANISVQLTHFSHSRKEEEDADAVGIVLAARAGYAPNGLATALNQIQSLTPAQSAAWTRVHPVSKPRLQRLAENVKSLGANPAVAGIKTIENNR